MLCLGDRPSRRRQLPGLSPIRLLLPLAALLLLVACGGPDGSPADAARLPRVTVVASPQAIELEEQEVAPGTGSLRLVIRSPRGHRLNSLASSHLRLSSSDPAVILLGESELSWRTDETAVEIPVPADFRAGEAEIEAEATVYYCQTSRAEVCYVRQLRLRLPVRVTSAATAGELLVDYELPPAGGP